VGDKANPFRDPAAREQIISNGSPPQPEPGAPPRDICPLFGLFPAPIPPRIMQPGAPPQIGLMPVTCQLEACHFWDAETSCCGFDLAFRTLAEIADGLKPLAGFFGKR